MEVGYAKFLKIFNNLLLESLGYFDIGSNCTLRNRFMNTVPVSVIIPTYNRSALLGRALDSVRAQSRKPAQLIVVDDGSTDDTAAMLANDFPEVEYFYQPNQGVSAARNVGLENASQPWIALLDSDDQWLPQKLEKQFREIQHNPTFLFCHTEEIWIRNGRRVNPMKKHAKYGGDIFKHCLPLCCVSPSSVLMHRDLLDAVGHFDETLPACEDYDLWLRVCSEFEVLFVKEPLIKKYGGHEDQLSREYWGMDRFRIQALEKILNAPHLSLAKRRLVMDTLMEKLRIFLLGAKKRGRDNEKIRAYEYQLNHWKKYNSEEEFRD